jgi:hypothetical protein
MTSELDLLDKDAAAALRQCREAEQSATDLLGRRDELRGLLDAYRYQQAHDLLWTAPCDLAAADAAVTGYQQAVLSLRRSGSRERA